MEHMKNGTQRRNTQKRKQKGHKWGYNQNQTTTARREENTTTENRERNKCQNIGNENRAQTAIEGEDRRIEMIQMGITQNRPADAKKTTENPGEMKSEITTMKITQRAKRREITTETSKRKEIRKKTREQEISKIPTTKIRH
jgi:hypothetical protein